MKIEITDKSFEHEYKCGGCNWGTSTFYSMEGEIMLDTDLAGEPLLTEEQAIARFGEDDLYNNVRPNGLCSDCFMEMLQGFKKVEV